MPAWIQGASRRKQRTLAVVGLFAVSALLLSGRVLAAPAAASGTPAAENDVIMVTNSGSNTVTDIGTPWNLTLGTGGYPDPVAVTPNDQYAYVANVSPGTVTVIGDADTGGTTATSHDPGQAYQAAGKMKIAGKWPRGLRPPAEDDGVRLQAGV